MNDMKYTHQVPDGDGATPFSNLSPADKIHWLYCNSKLKLAFLIIGLGAGAYLMLMAIINL